MIMCLLINCSFIAQEVVEERDHQVVVVQDLAQEVAVNDESVRQVAAESKRIFLLNLLFYKFIL